MSKRRSRSKSRSKRRKGSRRTDGVSRAEARMLAHEQGKRKTVGVAAVLGLVLVAFIVGFVLFKPGTPADDGDEVVYDSYERTEAPPDIVSGGDGGSGDGGGGSDQGSSSGDDKVSIPLSSIGKDAKFYPYETDGETVRYFAVEGPDGEPHVAFDACDVCYGEKKGYRQAGANMKCNNCGQEFAIDNLGTDNQSGGCWPSYLPAKVKGDSVQIKVEDLEGKEFMF